jgi:hypothetical protein
VAWPRTRKGRARVFRRKNTKPVSVSPTAWDARERLRKLRRVFFFPFFCFILDCFTSNGDFQGLGTPEQAALINFKNNSKNYFLTCQKKVLGKSCM